jgi:hypothetical protein
MTPHKSQEAVREVYIYPFHLCDLVKMASPIGLVGVTSFVPIAPRDVVCARIGWNVRRLEHWTGATVIHNNAHLEHNKVVYSQKDPNLDEVLNATTARIARLRERQYIGGN